MLAGHGDGVAEALRLALAHVVDVRHLGDGLHLLQLVELARLLQVVLQLERAVEVVLEAALAPAGDDQDVVDAAAHRLFDHVLDGRLVDDGQHLLGLRLGGREEPGAEPGSGDDSLAYGRGHPRSITVRQQFAVRLRAAPPAMLEGVGIA